MKSVVAAFVLVLSWGLSGCGSVGTIETRQDGLGQKVRVLDGMKVREDATKGGAINLRLEQIEGAQEVMIAVTGYFAVWPGESEPGRWKGRELRLATGQEAVFRVGGLGWSGEGSTEDVHRETVSVSVDGASLRSALEVDGVQIQVCKPSAPTAPKWHEGSVGCSAYNLTDDQLAQIGRFLTP